MGARFVCLDCGAEYGDHAEFCNACGSTRFERVAAPSSPKALTHDKTVLAVQGGLWVIAVVALLPDARTAWDIVLAWALTTLLGLTAGLVTRHLRAALLFSGLGAVYALAALALRI